ncbi:glycosyltransferase [Amphiplicatus metriothermophilus]|uniref:Glycosyltransferase involved in cell wall bisynthesis n=1 Tax=Amphiplicatus metriothermophilus TaxID=1519374 RepID=A0A239PSJ9_9PROT|nr:glycosyltransferase [Amphiplicatus metriothermophilus]MBB5519190.1 glycosyltransferase involved in cell wall biosynthesis [Amphiplicatus metriothermophilus]SNT73259.1 Glycosyltransferase involved in cell wall bisynthesis [Amphiplicatus metriothermophilus]
MRILTLTTLYPNAAMPAHGVFVENRLAAFLARSGAQAKVVAPVPWFPFRGEWAGRYGAFARAPARETRRGLEIRHPRYAIPPRLAMGFAPAALERCFAKAARALIAEGWDFDLIDAHYLYPDGVAAVRVARRLGKPVVLTARGSDATLLPRFPRPRRMILDAIGEADAVIAVAQALKDELVRLGAPAEKISVLRNGVDPDRFRPQNRAAVRSRLGLKGPVLLSVGHLIKRKGHDRVIAALAALPDATLLIAGEGPERARLERRARRLGVDGRARFLGAVPHEDLPALYSAADALVLASSREGWPNVLLEAMACGAPAVATAAGGTPEVVRAPEAGRLAAARTAEAVAQAVRSLLDDPPSRDATRAYAERHSWDDTAAGIEALFERIIAQRARADRCAHAGESRDPAPARKRVPAFAGTGGKDAPRLLVTVDAEEAFDWSRFDREGWRLCPTADIDRFQRIAEDFGARPVYLLAWPMLADPATADYFRMLKERGAADLGAHLHQWTTPPFQGFDAERHSWQCNLPPDVQRAKLAALGDAFEAAFGARPRAHRAGRYGVDARAYETLAACGIAFDFSPSPGFDFSARGGPDFSAMSNAPFRMETKEGAVLVVPASGGWFARGTRRVVSRRRAPPGLDGKPPIWPRALAAPARLTCEGLSFAELAALARALVRESPLLVFSLHSTSLTPGANAYGRDGAAVAAMLETCRRFFDFFRRELGGAFAALDDLEAPEALEAPPRRHA